MMMEAVGMVLGVVAYVRERPQRLPGVVLVMVGVALVIAADRLNRSVTTAS